MDKLKRVGNATCSARYQRATRWCWAAVVIGTPLSLIWPLMTNASDSFPLSTYPMFSKLREKPTVFQLRGYDAARQLVRIGPELMGTSEVLQAKVMIAGAVRQGQSARQRLCREVAARAARHRHYSQLQRIELVAARYDAIEYFTTARKPLSTKRLARCTVGSNREPGAVR